MQMSDIDRGMEQAMAARLAAALEQYDQQCAEMVRTWLDMEQYAAVSALVDEIRRCCGCLPRLSPPWVAFLISHSELVFCLWEAGSGNSCSPAVQACARDHSATLRNLRQGCARLCEGDQGGPAAPLPRWSAPHPAPRRTP
jgi:hypothetical protein